MKKIIVVGSGIAGLIAALQLSRRYAVTLVTKAGLADSNTRFAQGGIAAAMHADDSVAEHVADTLRAGAGLCDREAVEILCAEGPRRIGDLMALGVVFDRRDGELAQGREAAHSRARVLHAGGDATGLAIENTLVRALRSAGVDVLENTFACDLLVADERCIGLEILHASGRSESLRADAVVLASGGAGNLYPHTTNPAVATGDGVAMALRAGASLADLEFYQFHPTALAVPGGFLISEAVRGDGAVLRDSNGYRFMQDLHPEAELAPRDVVARCIAHQMALQNGVPVMLDATAMGAEFLNRRFPTIAAACARAGFDWSRETIPVTPAAHYWMGGVRTDVWGRTSLPGLFAVGEAACTGVHGANRLASNSLLESLVFSFRASEFLLEGDGDLRDWPQWSMPSEEIFLDEDKIGETPNFTRSELQSVLWKHAGIYRTQAGLSEAAQILSHWQAAGNTVEQRETRNLLELGRALVAAALVRCESRGAHYREDFPQTSPALQHQIALATRIGVAC